MDFSGNQYLTEIKLSASQEHPKELFAKFFGDEDVDSAIVIVTSKKNGVEYVKQFLVATE